MTTRDPRSLAELLDSGSLAELAAEAQRRRGLADRIRALLPPGPREVPMVTYFHENQLTYPLQGDERRDVHFALSHLHSILASAKPPGHSARAPGKDG